jgi:hypothetical protein
MKTSKFCAHATLVGPHVKSIDRVVKSGTAGQLGLFPRKPLRSEGLETTVLGIGIVVIVAVVFSGVVDLVRGKK